MNKTRREVYQIIFSSFQHISVLAIWSVGGSFEPASSSCVVAIRNHFANWVKKAIASTEVTLCFGILCPNGMNNLFLKDVIKTLFVHCNQCFFYVFLLIKSIICGFSKEFFEYMLLPKIYPSSENKLLLFLVAKANICSYNRRKPSF